MKKRIKGLKRKVLLPLMFSLAVTRSLNYSSDLCQDYKNERRESYLEEIAEKEAFEARNYLDSIAPALKYETRGRNCSEYVRVVGRDLYGKNYFYANAWDRKHLDEVVYSFSEDENAFKKIKNLEREGVLDKGMVLGVYHRPIRSNERDIYGREADYSHVVIFKGIDKKTGEFYFDHEWGHRQDTVSLSSMKDQNWKIMYLIDENTKSYAESIGNYNPNGS